MKNTLKNVYAWLKQNVWLPSKPWLKYSGASVTLIVNPCHWRWMPWFEADDNKENIWRGPDYKGSAFGWLFVIVKVWVDNDSW